MKDAAGFRRCAEIVSSRPDVAPVVVVSAMAGVTDELTAIIAEAEHGGGNVPEFLEKLRRQHADVINADIQEVVTRLEEVLRAIADAGKITPEARDSAVVVGEQLSARILGFA